MRTFEPDLTTPEQYQDRVRPRLVDQPEVRLMLAFMEDAVATQAVCDKKIELLEVLVNMIRSMGLSAAMHDRALRGVSTLLHGHRGQRRGPGIWL